MLKKVEMKKNVFKICALLLTLCQGAWAENVTFNVCSWDGTKVVTTEETRDATVIDTSGDTDAWYGLGDGYYVVKGEISWKTINVTGSVAHLILANGAKLDTKHVKLESGHTLHIYTQSGSGGALTVYNDVYEEAAGIGSAKKENAGDLYIHGGTITSTGNNYGAAIGGGYDGSCGNVHIYGGTVTANAGGGAAGIGGGYYNGIASSCSVNIYGGTVTATGNRRDNGHGGYYVGAGIGSGDTVGDGSRGQGGAINIFGGNVVAKSTYEKAAGIGPGNEGRGGIVNISGGQVQAFTVGKAAGIGGTGAKISITGGTIYAGAQSQTNTAVPAMAGEVTISDGLSVAQSTAMSLVMTTTAVSYAERVAKCTESRDNTSLCVKVASCNPHNFEGFFCTYCNYYKNTSVAGTWTDDNIRAEAFETEDTDQKIITITSESQLGLLAYKISHNEDYKGYTIRLEYDLDMSDHKWNFTAGTFQGTFDGQGHTISGIINSADLDHDAGLFPHNSGTVKRVKLFNSYIVGNRYIGAIAGQNTGTVEDCYVGADVYVVASNGDDSKGCGGIVGMQIKNPFDTTTPQTVGCYSEATVNGFGNVGGIVGQLGGTINYCVSKATIKSSGDNNGIVAGLVNEATYSNNYYIADAASNNAGAQRAFGVTLTDALKKESYKILAAADATKSYETSGIKTYSNQIAVGNDWYVCESGTFSFKLPAQDASSEEITWSYVTVNNGNVLQPTSETYSFTCDNTAAKYVIDGAAWVGQGTETNPYLIKSTANWNAINSVFGRVNETDLFQNVYFKQTADIEVKEIIGITSEVHSNKAFCGNYNGDKHSLRCQLVNTASGNAAAAPFFKVNGATIKNLRVEGSIAGGMHSAGLVAFITGTTATKIDYCRVSATIDSDDAYAGGFIGHLNESKIEISNSLFDGRLLSSRESGIYLGAFIGWSEPSATPSLTNCVEHGTYNTTGARTALGWKNIAGNPSVISGVQDSYYTSALEPITGSTRLFPLTSGMTTAPFVLTVTPEAADDNTAFPLGGYVGTINNNYYLGEKQDAQFYVKQGHNASFFISYAEPYLVKDVKVNDVAATILNADTHLYTYTQGDAASVVTGLFDPPLDGKGSEEDPWVITSEQDFYKMKDFREAQIPMYRKFFKVVKKSDNTPYTLSQEDVQVDGRLVISGDIELNTGAGKTLHVIPGIELSKGNKLTLGGAGTLKIDYQGWERAGIGAVEVGTLIINSGTINVEGGHYSAALGGSDKNTSGGTIIINGGEIYAVGGPCAAAIGGGEYGVCGDITINGGKVTAKIGTISVPSAIGSGQNADPSGTLTLGWTDADDYLVTGVKSGTPEALAQSLSSVTFTKPFLVDGTTTIATADDILMKKLVPVLDLKNAAANTTSLNSLNGKTLSTMLSDRTLYKDGSWNTLCLPFSLDNLTGTPLEGATVKTLESSSYANQTLTLNFGSDLTSIEAGKPYIVKWNSGNNITNPVFSGVTINNPQNDVATAYADFAGSFSPVGIEGEDKTMLYFGANNTLYYPNKAMTIGSCHACFKLKGISVGDLASATGSRIVMNFAEDATTTTSIHNSQLTIDNEAGAYYSLDGRKLNGKPAQKGVYIHQGRKVVVK